MDRRLPDGNAWSRFAPIAIGASLWLGRAAWALDSESRPIPLPGSSEGAYAGSLLAPMLAMAGALAVTAWLWARRARRARLRPSGSITVIDRAAMGRGRALSLVRVGDRVVLVGESAQGFQRLAEFAADDDAATAPEARRLAS